MADSKPQTLGLLLPYQALRQLIGWLGLSLPILLALGAWAFQTSVSDYYYTKMRDYLEGVLFFLAAFLFVYRPYGRDGWQDNVITSLAGTFALILALFPSYNETLHHVPSALVLPLPVSWSGTLHNVGAGGLFVCFAVMSLFYFTKGSREGRSGRKKLRNAVYIVAGLGIALCIGWIGWNTALAPDQTARDVLDIFKPEATALILFGISWLVKGEAVGLLNDKKQKG